MPEIKCDDLVELFVQEAKDFEQFVRATPNHTSMQLSAASAIVELASHMYRVSNGEKTLSLTRMHVDQLLEDLARIKFDFVNRGL